MKEKLTVSEVYHTGLDSRLIRWSDGHTETVTVSQAIDYLVDWNGGERADYEGKI